MSYKNIEQLPSLIQELYSIVNKLETIYSGRKFTLDGHLVGSIGEVLVSYYYDLKLLPASTETHDAISKDGKLVQIKATQGRSVALRSQPDYLIVIKLLSDGNIEEIYNGPGARAWAKVGKMQKNGQCPISLTTLKKLMDDIPLSMRLKKVM